jgi:hypothetical protein
LLGIREIKSIEAFAVNSVGDATANIQTSVWR